MAGRLWRSIFFFSFFCSVPLTRRLTFPSSFDLGSLQLISTGLTSESALQDAPLLRWQGWAPRRATFEQLSRPSVPLCFTWAVCPGSDIGGVADLRPVWPAPMPAPPPAVMDGVPSSDGQPTHWVPGTELPRSCAGSRVTADLSGPFCLT